VLELLLLELQALLGGGQVDEGASDLGDLLEHLLVGEIEHLVGLLGGVERLVRLGLHDVVRPLEDAHVSLPEGSVRHPTIDSNQQAVPLVADAPGDGRRVHDPEAATIGPLRCVPDMSPSPGASPKDDTWPSAVTIQ
jgi:hypothetical protein